MWVGFLQRGGPAAAAVSWETAGTPRGGRGRAGRRGGAGPGPGPGPGFRRRPQWRRDPGSNPPDRRGKGGPLWAPRQPIFHDFPAFPP